MKTIKTLTTWAAILAVWFICTVSFVKFATQDNNKVYIQPNSFDNSWILK